MSQRLALPSPPFLLRRPLFEPGAGLGVRDLLTERAAPAADAAGDAPPWRNSSEFLRRNPPLEVEDALPMELAGEAGGGRNVERREEDDEVGRRRSIGVDGREPFLLVVELSPLTRP